MLTEVYLTRSDKPVKKKAQKIVDLPTPSAKELEHMLVGAAEAASFQSNVDKMGR